MKFLKKFSKFRIITQKQLNKSTGLFRPVFTKVVWVFLLLASVLLSFFTLQIDAQPIQIEFLLGNSKVNFNSMISTSPGEGSFHFINITIFDNYHNPENKQFNAGINHSYLYWDVTGRIGAGPAVTFHPARGMTPKIGFQYLYITDQNLIRVGPAVTYDERVNLEMLVNASHSIHVYQNWRLFTEIRSIHNYAAFRYHEKSIDQFRIGLGIRTYSFGIANEIDRYGPHRITKWNTGFFVRHNIF